MPISFEQIAKGSYVGICLELFCVMTSGEEKRVGSGTGFIYRWSGRDFLITNWHVVTGRRPDDPATLLDGYPDSPSRVRIYMAGRNAPLHFLPLHPTMELYADGKPNWIETSVNGMRLDLVAIPMQLGEDAMVVRVNELSVGNEEPLGVLHDVVIVGYPFGIMPSNPFPIWKRASIASEPRIAVGGLPKFYLDSPGRPGMSGSPVFRLSSGAVVSAEEHRAITEAMKSGSSLDAIAAMPDLRGKHQRVILQLVGIYSGSVGDRQLSSMGLGVTWHASCLNLLFDTPALGDNPYPPASIGA